MTKMALKVKQMNEQKYKQINDKNAQKLKKKI